jgi:hypothetical protein
MATLSDFPYAQESGNDQWNDSTPMLEWTVHTADEEEVFLPYLSDCVLQLNNLVYYTHVTIISSGERGSVFLGNVVADNRSKKENEENDTVMIDLSGLLPTAGGETKAFEAVLDYMYTGSTVFPHNYLASIVMMAYVLRIKSLFKVAKQMLVDALKGKDGVGAKGSAVEVLTGAQRMVANEDTEDLLAAIVCLAKATVNAGGNSTNFSGKSQSKTKRRRASYKAAMNSVHKKAIGVTARVKPVAPGHLNEKSETDTSTSRQESKLTKEGDNAVQEHIVGSAQTPGQRIQSVYKGRRFSFTVPKGALPGDVLKVVVPKPSFAKPQQITPPPPPPIQEEEEEEEEEEEQEQQKEDPLKALFWVYVDADGMQFGPFARDLMRGWHEGDMIPNKLCVRPADRVDLDFVPIDELFHSVKPFFLTD